MFPNSEEIFTVIDKLDNFYVAIDLLLGENFPRSTKVRSLGLSFSNYHDKWFCDKFPFLFTNPTFIFDLYIFRFDMTIQHWAIEPCSYHDFCLENKNGQISKMQRESLPVSLYGRKSFLSPLSSCYISPFPSRNSVKNGEEKIFLTIGDCGRLID